MAEMGRITPPTDARQGTAERARQATERFAAWMDFLRHQYARDCARGREGAGSVKPLRGAYNALRDTVPVRATVAIPLPVIRKVAGKCVEPRCANLPAHKAGHR